MSRRVAAPTGWDTRLSVQKLSVGQSVMGGHLCSIPENQSRVRHRPHQVQDPAEHPGSGEGHVWSRVAQSGGHAGTAVAEKVGDGVGVGRGWATLGKGC